MERRTFETTLAPVPIWADFERFSAERPLVVVIRGAFARIDQYGSLPPLAPECDFAFVHLPGVHSPHIASPSLARFAEAYDEALSTAFPDRQFVKLGISVGGLVAMAMRAGGATLALDPPLSTGGLWPLREAVTPSVQSGPDMRAWCWSVFGMDGERVVNRDYRPLVLSARRPLTIMIAGLPLEPKRPLGVSPGLISAEDREWLRTVHDIRRVWVGECGHNLAVGAALGIVDEIRRLVALTPA